MSTHAADTEYLVRKAAGTGYQFASLLIPPVYTALILARRGRGTLSVNRLLRATWVGGLGGGLTCGGLAYGWYARSNEEFVKTKRLQTVYDDRRVRADDHAMIGTFLMSVLTPALFWHRAHAVNLVLGGAGLGSSFGLLTYYGRSLISPGEKTDIPVASIP